MESTVSNIKNMLKMNDLDVKKIRESLGYTQEEFGNLIGVSRNTIMNYEKGGTIPESKRQILSKLISEKHKNVQVVKPEIVIKADDFENNNGNRFIELPNGQFFMTMPLADFNIQAGFLDHYQDAEFLMDMQQHGMWVDKPVKGRYVAFRVSGDSMDDGSINSIPRNSVVATRELQRQHWITKIRFRDFPYWVIYNKHSKMPLIKEMVHHDPDTGNITFHSLNDSPEFEDFVLNVDDIQALFYVIDVNRGVSKKLTY